MLADTDCPLEDLGVEVGLSAVRAAGFWARNSRDLDADELALLDDEFTAAFPKAKAGLTLEAMASAGKKVRATNNALAELFRRFDMLIMPVFGDAAGLHGQQMAAGHLSPLNFCGYPAVVLRTGLTTSGLPCALQLAADRGQEAELLTLAAHYEARFQPFGDFPGFPFRPRL